MGFLLGLLTLVLVLDCVVLVLLVLIQLPKKEAGAGLAFGGAASDALFGAGSGNVLTKITKYFAVTFFVLAILLSLLQNNYRARGTSALQQSLANPGSSQTSANVPPPPGSTPPANSVATGMTNTMISPMVENTNSPTAPPATTNTAPAAPK